MTTNISSKMTQKLVRAVRYYMEHPSSVSNRFDIEEVQRQGRMDYDREFYVRDKKTLIRYYVNHGYDEYTGRLRWLITINKEFR